MRKFNIEKLPKDVRSKINFIEWNEHEEFDEEICGLVWLKKGYVLDYDGSITDCFTNRSNLISLIRSSVIERKEND